MTDKEGNITTNKEWEDLEAYSDISEFAPAIGRWDVTHKELINLPIIILNAEEGETSYGECFFCDIVLKDERLRALIGASVLRKKLAAVKDRLPLRATIVMRKKYYDFE